jgi:hypothetical protein
MPFRDTGLIGYGSSIYEKGASRPELSFLADAARAALASASISKADIDGLATSSTTLAPDNAVTAAEYLGLSLSWAYVSTAGGAGALASVLNAVRAIEAGHATHILCLAGCAQDSAFFRERISRFTGALADYLAPMASVARTGSSVSFSASTWSDMGRGAGTWAGLPSTSVPTPAATRERCSARQ